MARKDKQKVIDDVWTEDHIRTYLAFDPPEGVDRDFHRLQKAYQSMREEDFETFLEMFKASGGDIQARGPEGQTLAEEAARHKGSAGYVELLMAVA